MLDHRLAAVEEQDESDNDGSTDKLKRKRGRPFKNSEKDKTVDGVVLPDRKRPVPLASVNSLDRSGRSLVFRYAARGDYSTTRALIEAGADLSIKDYAGWTALHEACLAGHSRVVELLLMHGALVDARGGDGDTPLHDAVGNGHVSVVQLLLRYGASYELVGESGLTPLEFANANVESLAEEPSNAASQEDIGSVAKELKMSENFDSSSLKAADLNWSGGNSAVVEETEVDQVLLNSNSSNNNSNSKNSKNENAASGSVMGGNVNFGDEQLAARQIVSILQDWKIMTAEVVKRDEFGQTILHMAAKDGDLQRLSDLLWYGADVNAADNIGWTPLHDSALGGHAECLNKLLAFGALPNSTSKEKSTPLSDAAANGHYQCVHILLQYGALVPKDLISSFDSNLSESHLKCHRLLDRPSHSWMPHTTSEYHPKKYNPEQAVSPSDDAKPDHAEPAPNPFAWGGLDPNHGTFESSREEKKFQALWKTLEGTQGNGKAHLKRKPESSDDENGHIAQVETKIAKKGPGRGRPRRQPSESKLEDDISLPDIKSEVEAPISSSNMPM